MFAEDKEQYFPTHTHPDGKGFQPWYERVGRKVYRSYGHPEGKSSDAEFVVQQDKLIPLNGHAQSSVTGAPWFVKREDKIYPGYGHPAGTSRVPWFESRR
ncbi:hypothetical protein [Marinobacterium stanieri]|jgi:hypothetical protein|uniref:Uncharacterized protein n=1 Tax=Marinobacterium stanieri TaxID=49186 RepID=A0A1N6UTX3_9GAMM|nr:hypothetical protein [Marinobacterium stanieri]SIQ69094.1 hypothetical protein SAMN05421647_107224 [Marinobacterium stanieri]